MKYALSYELTEWTQDWARTKTVVRLIDARSVKGMLVVRLFAGPKLNRLQDKR